MTNQTLFYPDMNISSLNLTRYYEFMDRFYHTRRPKVFFYHSSEKTQLEILRVIRFFQGDETPEKEELLQLETTLKYVLNRGLSPTTQVVDYLCSLGFPTSIYTNSRIWIQDFCMYDNISIRNIKNLIVAYLNGNVGPTPNGNIPNGTIPNGWAGMSAHAGPAERPSESSGCPTENVSVEKDTATQAVLEKAEDSEKFRLIGRILKTFSGLDYNSRSILIEYLIVDKQSFAKFIRICDFEKLKEIELIFEAFCSN